MDAAALSKGERTRRAVLDAAIARFGREGFRATSVADIARDAGVGGTAAYAYFPGKEALFLAAVDEDAAAVIREGLTDAPEQESGDDHRADGSPAVPKPPDVVAWWQGLIFTLVAALDRHPLARRLLAGLEPEVTPRVLDIPALAELRKVCAERLRQGQVDGTVRADIDVAVMANGAVAIVLSLLMSVVQLGADAAAPYGPDIAAVFDAAISDPTTRGAGR